MVVYIFPPNNIYKKRTSFFHDKGIKGLFSSKTSTTSNLEQTGILRTFHTKTADFNPSEFNHIVEIIYTNYTLLVCFSIRTHDSQAYKAIICVWHPSVRGNNKGTNITFKCATHHTNIQNTLLFLFCFLNNIHDEWKIISN